MRSEVRKDDRVRKVPGVCLFPKKNCCTDRNWSVFWNSGVYLITVPSRGKLDWYIAVNTCQFQLSVHCNNSHTLPHGRQLWKWQPTFLAWVAGAGVDNEDLVLQLLGLCVLIAYCFFWSVWCTKESHHCFNPYWLKQLPEDLERQNLVIFRTFKRGHAHRGL